MMFAKPIAREFGLYPFNLKTFTPKRDKYLWMEETFTKPFAKRMAEDDEEESTKRAQTEQNRANGRRNAQRS